LREVAGEWTPNCAPVKRFFSLALLSCALLAPQVARASEPAVDLSVGTSGISAGIEQPVGPATDVRLSYGVLDFTNTQSFSNLVIDVTANLSVHEAFHVRTLGLYADHTIHGSFYATAGLVYNLNQINGTSVPTGSSVVIDGVVYPQASAGVIYTVVRWPAIAPYLGIGFGPPIHGRRHAGLFGDAGLYYQGPARVEFSATGAILANYAKFQPYFDEGRRQLTTGLAPVEVYPVIRLGLRIPI
jgi:hypothetical protein